jgi:hypothetical protein
MSWFGNRKTGQIHKSDHALGRAIAPVVEDLESRRLLANGDFGAIISVGGAGEDRANHVAVDRFGSIYVVGKFSGTSADFDPGADTKLLNSAGGSDIFVAKYSSSGSLVWAVQAGGTSDDEASSVVVDAAGDVYIAGVFQGKVDFRPGRRESFFTAKDRDAFLWKLNNDGKLVWNMKAGGDGHDAANALAIDAAGNVHAAGFFATSAKFGKKITLSGTARNAFVMKVTPTGGVLWAKNFGATGTTPAVDARAVGVDSDGAVYVGGVFNNTADFDPGTATSNLTSAGLEDAFVTKLNASGGFVWTRGIGGTLAEDLTGIAVDRAKNVLITGAYTGTADFDPEGGTENLTSAGSTDIFVAKLTTAGAHVWSKSMGGTGADTGLAIATDKFGNAFTTGNFNTTGDFNPAPGTAAADIFTLSSGSNLNHGFVSRLTFNGDFVYAKGFFAGSSGQLAGSGIALGTEGALWTVGAYTGTTDFNPGTGTQNKTSTSFSVDVFASRLVR